MAIGTRAETLTTAGLILEVLAIAEVDGRPLGPRRQAITDLAVQLLAQPAFAGLNNVVERRLWSELSAIVGVGGQLGNVLDDAGTHTDPVNGAAGRPNAGRYRYSADPAGWERIGDYVAVSLATTAEVIAGILTGKAAAPAGVLAAILAHLATSAEAIAGTSTALAVTPAGDKAALDARFGIGSASEIYETLAPDLQSVAIRDPDGRIIATVPDPRVGALAASAVTVEYYETLDETVRVIFADPDGRELGRLREADSAAPSAEVVAARGSAVDLNTRISRGLTAYGDVAGPVWGAWNLQETRMRLRKLLLGESSQLVIALIGDSYTQAVDRYVRPSAKTLQDTYGFAGVGWIGFGWFGTSAGTWSAGSQPSGMDLTARSDLVTVQQIIGTWTCIYNNAASNTPSLSRSTSSTAGDYVRWSFPAGHNACRLFYGGDGTGVVQVSWDDGATWSGNVVLNTAGAANLALAGTPASAATARIKVISGNVSLAGVDMQSAANGVRVHKLGGSGSTAAQWAGVTAATWAAQYAALAPKQTDILFGTNDQAIDVTPSTFGSQIGTIVSNIRSVLPWSDRLIMAPAENQREDNDYPMSAYTQAQREVAIVNNCAFLDFQYYFGPADNFAFAYAHANSARPWNAADLIHPESLFGGRAMVDAWLRLQMYS
ncbi:MAG TPA: SGNH/GDSL hydrolase family protein [Xanthobacteraceae bacterium]|nr:SGNH/GDSL hydrolase family protein [Xanthobacteraceae bacterium]